MTNTILNTNNDVTKLTINRETLIKDVSKDLDRKYKVEEITEIINNLEWWCNHYLAQATPTKDVQVRLFYGLQLNSTYKPESVRNTLYGNAKLIPAHIDVKPRYTRCHKKYINELSKEKENV